MVFAWPGMNAVLRFFQAWLVLVFVLAFFVVPTYALAIYPEVPAPYRQLMRGYGLGSVAAEASLAGFLLRLVYCGGVVALGLAIAWRSLAGLGTRPRKGRADAP